MRRSRVVSCLASSTQQMNSLRAKGVMSFQAASAVALPIRALRRSLGSWCTTPPGTRGPLTKASYKDAHEGGGRPLRTRRARDVWRAFTGLEAGRMPRFYSGEEIDGSVRGVAYGRCTLPAVNP